MIGDRNEYEKEINVRKDIPPSHSIVSVKRRKGQANIHKGEVSRPISIVTLLLLLYGIGESEESELESANEMGKKRDIEKEKGISL